MPGTVIGGSKAAQTIRKKYGPNFYNRIGELGGKKSRGGGFATDEIGEDGLTGKERARVAGKKGGLKGRKTIGG